jgi:hypothetical protein
MAGHIEANEGRSGCRSRRAIALAALLAVVAFTKTARAQQTVPSPEDGRPIQLALFNPVQIHPESASIFGLRLSLFYGHNRNVSGFDYVVLGANVTDGDFAGVGWSWFGANIVHGQAMGWQSGLANFAGDGLLGLQTGFFNMAGGESTGVQLGAVNVAEVMAGVQLSAVNVATEFKGLQLGLVNVTQRMRGLQMGLINVIAEGRLPFMVIANASF